MDTTTLPSTEVTKEEQFWLNKLSADMSMGSFVLHERKTGVNPAEIHQFQYSLPEELSREISALGRGSEYGIFIILVSGIQYLLSIYTRNQDVSLGIPVLQSKSGVSFQDHPLIIRQYLRSELTFKELLLEVQQNIVEANKHQRVSYDQLSKLLEKDSSTPPSLSPRTMVAMQNIQNIDFEYPSYADTIFQFNVIGEQIECKVSFKDQRKHEQLRRVLDQLNQVLLSGVRNPTGLLSEISMLSEEEKDRVLYQFNDTATEPPETRFVVELFEGQVVKTPDEIAVGFKDQQVSYKELNRKVNRIAHRLVEEGVGEGSIVGILVERSLEMPVGFLGIVKSGGAYLSIDPNYPTERIDYLLTNSNVEILLKTGDIHYDAPGHIHTIDIDKVLAKEANSPSMEENLGLTYAADGLMYILFTSGTTGEPKAAMLKRNSFVNLLTWYIREVDMENVLMMAPMSFDTAHKNLFAPLISGGCLRIIDPGIYDYHKISDDIINHQITTLNCAPSAFYPLLDYNKKSNYIKLSSLKNVVLGGESLNTKKLQPWILSTNCHCEMFNTYGPTECTDITTFYKVSHEEIRALNPVSIGKPIPHVEVYMVDSNMNPLPVGVMGELCVSGISLGRGYYKAQARTASKFVNLSTIYEKKVYKTGDLARWLPDGTIEYIGRIDHQTKIRGFRVELGEIETCMVKHPDVEEVVVISLEDSIGTQTLSAYFVADVSVPIQQLRSFLAERLPEYMVPGYITQLDQMPLTQNGKINRKKLPTTNLGATASATFVAPENEIEQRIAQIWAEVLEVKKVGLDDDFFQLGGHSLKAAAILLKVNDQLETSLHLSEIFRQPTVRELALLVSQRQELGNQSIHPTEQREYYPVSSQQKRLFILWQLEENSVAYNLPTATMIEGNLNREKLSEAIQRLMEHHESLRTSFAFAEGELVQRIHPHMENIVDFAEVKEEELEDHVQRFIQPFDLEHAPLFRVKVLQVDHKKHLLLTDAHHIIFDGISMELVMREFIRHYDGDHPVSPTLQYRDYAVWQQRMNQSELFKKNEAYWLEVFKNDVPVLQLNTDFPRQPSQHFMGDRVSIETSAELTSRLRSLAATHGTTLYMVLLSAFNTLLYKYTGQEDIAIGSPVSGRNRPGLEALMGMFVNTVVMRNFPRGDQSFNQLLAEVKENTLNALDHEDYPFELLVDQLGVQRNTERNPLFDVLFTLENEPSVIDTGELSFHKHSLETGMTQFDLSIHAFENKESISFDFQYRTALFVQETMDRMAEQFIQLLDAVSSKGDILLREVRFLPKQEEKKILIDFNTTAGDVLDQQILPDLFAEQVKRTPTSLALSYGGEELTYVELDKRANQLARYLRRKGVDKKSIVAIVAEPSLEMVIGVWAVLKSGGAYLPIDPDFPEGRVDYILQDSGCKHVLMQSQFTSRFTLEQEVLDFADEEIVQEDGSPLQLENSPEDLAYVIYTSGTTGRPKGVMVEHRQIVNQLLGLITTLEFDASFSHLLLAKFTFDVSVQQLLLPFLSGGQLFIPEKETTVDPKRLWSFIEENQVDVMGAVPAHMNALLANLDTRPRLRTIMLAGEAFTTKLYDQLQASIQAEKIVNLYGPTEATIYATCYICDGVVQGTSLPIGKPLTNYKAYILNPALHPVPIGVTGELWIGGAGVARGYRNRLELTQERFMENPFAPGERMYRTGDLVRWLPDGKIQYIGREDHQVKIKGVRIEPNEINVHLVKHPRVTDAVVIPKSTPDGDLYLCAYVVTDERMMIAELRSFLEEIVPHYMIPAHFVRLDQLPLTSSDKVDIKQLQEKTDDQYMSQGTNYTEPVTPLEKAIASIWQQILGVKQVGLHDHFFDLGGNSLTVIQVSNRLREELNIEMPVVALFRYTTIYSLAKQLQGDSREGTREAADRSQVMKESKNRLKQRMKKKRGLK
ncbi:fengycin family lipopeptide synthetase D [Marininema mesophilum]|uniref:Fengycin family lipopeptide synthetase D n=1 Tax=Marininema mesophilum TaxID=1048340 RepID=A0A1H3B1K7_9BACL|nr:non-ribosomal peptide synthetase [Marininema mesophilum]SDX35822.1 fengycin family lipopeptide synthetase D [Marininema mesophilum]